MTKRFFHTVVPFVLLCCFLMSFLSCSRNSSDLEQETLSVKKTAMPSAGVGRYIDSVEPNSITICLDPGHGFDDGGCSSDLLVDTTEKELTLLYANLVKDRLEQLGYSVVMTHDGESFPQAFNENNNNKYSPEERTAYANSLDIDYFISFHCDSFNDDFSVKGTRIYYCESSYKQQFYSADVAEAIQKRLCQAFPNDKDPAVHNMKVSESYYVIRETYAASALIEVGFITNSDDVEKLTDAEWQKTFSIAVAEGIDDYFSQQRNADGDFEAATGNGE